MKTGIVVGLIILLMGCNQVKYEASNRFSSRDFSQTIHLNEVGEGIELISSPSMLALSGDSLLFINSAENGKMLTKINLRSNNEMDHYIDFGSGPNDMGYCKHIRIKGDTVWLFDKQLTKVVKFLVSSFSESDQVECIDFVRIKNCMFDNVQWIGDVLVANSLSTPDSRFVMYSREGTVLKDRVSMPDYGTELSTYAQAEAFLCKMCSYRDSILFLAYNNTDLIEKYDQNGLLLKRMHGPDGFFPDVNEARKGDMLQIVHTPGVARIGYESPVIVNDELWVLYSGKVFDPTIPNLFLMDEILVFDLDLNPVRRYKLDRGIYSFDVDTTNKIIYGLTVEPDIRITTFQYN